MADCVSIIIPIYNSEKFLRDCLDSLVNQTYKEIEIVCVDDGSKDSSGKICDEYSDKYSNFKVIHQPNGGVCAARNAGLDNATGDYVCFVDSDDTIPANAIEILHTKIKEYSANIVIGNAAVELSNGKFMPFFEISNDIVSEGKENILKRIPQYIYDSAWAKLYDKKAIDGVRFKVGKKINEDGFFVFESLKNCTKIVEINNEVYNYLYRAGSASHSEFSEKYYDILYFRDEKVKTLNETYPDNKKLINAVYTRHSISFLNLLIRAGHKKYEKEIKDMVKDIRKHCKPIDYLPKKEKFKLFLIKHCAWVYIRIMRRGLKNG